MATTAVQAVENASTDAQFCACDTDQNRLKGFLGVSKETVEAMNQTVVEKYRAMSDAELFAIGEKALGDIADDIIALDEIRTRFRRGHAILGYVNWKEFVQRNSKYSIRTVQNRLAEIHGKDESKVNDRYKNPMYAVETTPENKVEKTPVIAGEKVNYIFVWEQTDEVESTDHSKVWIIENLKTGLAELWRTCDIRRLKNGETPKLNKGEMAYDVHNGADNKEAGLAYWAEKTAWAQERLAELKADVPQTVPPVRYTVEELKRNELREINENRLDKLFKGCNLPFYVKQNCATNEPHFNVVFSALTEKQVRNLANKLPSGTPVKEPAASPVAPVYAIETDEPAPDFLNDISDSPAFEQVEDIPVATPIAQGEIQESSTKQLQELFNGTPIIVKACTAKDGLKSCTGRFNLIGLTKSQIERFVEILERKDLLKELQKHV